MEQTCQSVHFNDVLYILLLLQSFICQPELLVLIEAAPTVPSLAESHEAAAQRDKPEEEPVLAIAVRKLSSLLQLSLEYSLRSELFLNQLLVLLFTHACLLTVEFL